MFHHILLYIDPGSGSILFQALIAGLVGFIAVIKIYWKKIIGIFVSKKDDEPEKN
ncbi:MAG: hypothetical protein Q8M29_00705 [Bacteroidota bacterium]|nr:hypothetical protein [Bacteroidota bacterium]